MIMKDALVRNTLLPLSRVQFQMLESEEIEKYITEIEKEREEEAEKKKQKK